MSIVAFFYRGSSHHFFSDYQDATEKILKLLDCKPDLIIGNYTDGNIVASLMASRLGVTQVNFTKLVFLIL